MQHLRLVPPLDPKELPEDPPVVESYIACPDGTLISGLYIKWQGSFYEGYRIGGDLWVEHRVKGELAGEWIPLPGSFNRGSGRSSFRRNVPMDEVERYVSLQSYGTWQELEFEIVAYEEDGSVAIRGEYSPAMIELLESGSAPQLEVCEAGRAGVIGDLPWAEMSNFRTEMVDLPLPGSEVPNLHAVPPLDPDNFPPDTPVLERYIACPGGTLVSGIYIKWQGSYYSAYSMGTDMWIRHRVSGDLSVDWIPIPGTFHEGSGRSSFRRNIPMDEVERYVSLQSTGFWQGLKFGIVAYSDDGTVAVRGGYSPGMKELLESGSAPQLEVVESGRAGVIGDLQWSEMSNFSTEMTDLPLPGI